MVVWHIVSLLIAPLLAFLIYYFLRSANRDGDNSLLWKAFFFGILSIIFFLVLQYLGSIFDLDNFRSLRRIIFYSFVIMGFGSEFGKYLFLRYYFLPKDEFKGPIDGVVYGVMLSLGFAEVGNIIYLFYYETVDIVYSITVIFANVFFGIIMGFFVGLAKTRENRFIDSMTGLFAAVFFHALYNFCFITMDYRLLTWFMVGSFVVVSLLVIKAGRIKLESDRFGN